jgi:hypothetical protein
LVVIQSPLMGAASAAPALLPGHAFHELDRRNLPGAAGISIFLDGAGAATS